MARTLYLYRPGHPKASQSGFINADDLQGWVERPPELPVFGDSHYDGMQATDGTPIDTRRKHREYMRANGLTTADDYIETWKRAEADRQRTGEPSRERRESLGRAIYEAERKRK